MSDASSSSHERPLRVVALTRTGPLGPSTRYRIEQYRPWLGAHGIEVLTLPLFGPTWFRLLGLRPVLLRVPLKALYSLGRLLVRAGQARAADRRGADLVLVEQQLFPYLPWVIERLLLPRRTPWMLEFDDALWLTPGHASKLRRLCEHCGLVIVGNEYLADFARPHARRVVVVPTTLDLARYDCPPPPGDETLRIGWIGLPYNLAYLELLAGPLSRLAARGLRVELRVISSALPPEAPCWDGVPRVLRPWSEASEVDEIAACDIGVMPLPDTAWTRGKCGLKLLQFMAAGRPVVASPVGVNTTIVRDGENGLLAADESRWEAALERLARHPELRAALGKAGRQTVERDYSLIGAAPKLADSYRQAAAPPHPP